MALLFPFPVPPLLLSGDTQYLPRMPETGQWPLEKEKKRKTLCSLMATVCKSMRQVMWFNP